MPKQSMRVRARNVFSRVEPELAYKIRDTKAEWTKTNNLGNSRIVFAYLQAVSDVGENGLDECHRSMGVAHKYRGRKWKEDAADIRRELDLFLDRARSAVATHCNEGPQVEAFNSNIGQPSDHLRQRHDDFIEGWTGAEGMPWHQRHPLLYSAATAIGSVMLSIGAALLTK